MPTATSFNALGAGNGFTHCLDKVDVSGYEFWTTLGGNQKNGSVTESGKGLSQAMKIFWNVNSADSSYDHSFSVLNLDVEINGDQSLWDSMRWYYVGSGSVTNTFFAPKDRVCYEYFTSSRSAVSDDGGSVSLDLVFRSRLARLYNGSTGSESNFVGYGLSQALAWTSQNGGGGNFFSGLQLHSYTNDAEFSLDTSEYISLNGISLVAQYFDPSGGGGGTVPVTITTAGNKVTCDVEFVSSDETFTTELGFYTY